MGIGAAVLGSGLIGAGAQIISARSAAGAQTSAADRATAAQLAMFGVAREGLQPFIDAGRAGAGTLARRINDWTAPIKMDQANLEATPGYKFLLGQGLKATENSAAARGLGVSGAALKGAAEFTKGLADTTYNTRFEQELANRNLKLGNFFNLAGMGANAAAGQSTAAVNTGANIGANITGAGNAQGASDIAVGNAIGGGANSLVQSLLARQLYGGGGGGGVFAPVH